MPSALQAYLKPHILTILLLGFSSGLPRLLVASTLGAWLADNSVDRAAIGLFAYVALPYSFNFVWAPFLDQLKAPILSRFLGRRQSWMIISQISIAFMLVGLGQTNPVISPWWTAAFALGVAFFSASQDIIIDAYRTEYLDDDEYGPGAAVAVFGYRVGMLVAGAGALAFADMDIIGWPYTYVIMALCMSVGVITVLVAGEPNVKHTPIIFSNVADWLEKAVAAPFLHFAKHTQDWLLVLLFVALYRMSDGFIGFMSTPFMIDLGFTKTEIATIGKLYGFGATIVGTFFGGWLLYKIGLLKSLMIFGILQLGTNLGYILLAVVGPQTWALIIAITGDNLSGGMVTVAAIALMMRLCKSDYTATQYALLSSLASLASITLAGGAGWVAQHYGWIEMFSLSGLFGLPCLFILYRIRNHPAMKAND
jgi:PAT family beta-lactamase induction signal transducer AmpG